LFPPETLHRVQLIQAALSIGFSVRELCDIFRERESGAAPCRRVRELAAEKLGAVEARLRELRSCRRELRKALGEWDHLLANTPRGKQARLLEAFAATHPKSGTRRSPLGVLARGKRKKEK
jgi:DNA-binding transcriptional MerR regulator